MFSFTKKIEAAGGQGQSKKHKVRCEVHVCWEESRAPEEQYEGWCEAMSLVIATGKPWAFRIHKRLNMSRPDGSSRKERVFLAVALWESRGVLAPRPRLLISEVQTWRRVREPAPSGQDGNGRIMSGSTWLEKGLQPQRFGIMEESTYDPHGDP